MVHKVKDKLQQAWEHARNRSWQKQEEFVQLLIHFVADSHGKLRFFINDKYARHASFKHTDGTVGSVSQKVIDDFESNLEKYLSN